ncbi:hypothetical protein ACP6PL_12110 [Dapis sp. BLCC M126]|uniref:hypothetical protein n=1 Tax=Dapis sp. BLCC M126 TaxID=3400189 RepID=UPI003CF2C680
MKTKFSSLIKHFALTLLIGLASISLLITNASTAFAGDLVFYEGNNCSQDVIATYDSSVDVNDNCKDTSRCDNDEARSLLIKGPVEYTTVDVYDSPDGGRDDDFSIIRIRSVSGGDSVCIGTFEKDYDDGDVQVIYEKDNGLDGKISHITVIPF